MRLLWWALPVVDLFKASTLLGFSALYAFVVAKSETWFGGHHYDAQTKSNSYILDCTNTIYHNISMYSYTLNLVHMPEFYSREPGELTGWQCFRDLENWRNSIVEYKTCRGWHGILSRWSHHFTLCNCQAQGVVLKFRARFLHIYYHYMTFLAMPWASVSYGFIISLIVSFGVLLWNVWKSLSPLFPLWTLIPGRCLQSQISHLLSLERRSHRCNLCRPCNKCFSLQEVFSCGWLSPTWSCSRADTSPASLCQWHGSVSLSTSFALLLIESVSFGKSPKASLVWHWLQLALRGPTFWLPLSLPGV